MPADTCGARRDGLVCDRAPHDDGDHRGYDEEHDAVLFWPTSAAELEALERALRSWLDRSTPAERLRAAARLAVVLYGPKQAAETIATALVEGGRS